jgi:hypothetical protein
MGAIEGTQRSGAMAEQILPEVGDLYEYGGQQVKVVSVKKRGRGWQVQYESASGETGGTARLKDWQKSVQRGG